MVWLRFNPEKKRWEEIPKEKKIDTDVNIARRLKKCLDHYKSQIKKDNDIVILVTGEEGSGKSSLMGSILEYMSDGKFNPSKDLIGSDYLDGLEKIQHLKRGGLIGFDEGNSFFLSTETVTRQHRDLHKIFSIFRQKNLFVVICLPSFFRLGTYFAIDRSEGLIRTYIKNGARGSFAYYGKKGKNLLYRLGKKHYNENAVQPKIRATFTKCYKLETEDYRKFKSKTLNEEIEKAKSKIKKQFSRSEVNHQHDIEIIKKNMETPPQVLGKLLGLTKRRIYQLKKEIKEKEIIQFSQIKGEMHPIP